MKVRRIKLGSAVEFYINDEQTVLYNKKGGVLGRYMNCAPLPPLLTSNFSLSPEVVECLGSPSGELPEGLRGLRSGIA